MKIDYTTKCNLQIQCKPYQITCGIFQELEQKISQFIWKHKRPPVANNLEKEDWSSRNQSPRPQTILRSYSNQDSVVLAQGQTH